MGRPQAVAVGVTAERATKQAASRRRAEAAECWPAAPMQFDLVGHIGSRVMQKGNSPSFERCFDQ